MKNLTDYWTGKSDHETLEKQVELDTLKSQRAKDFDKYQTLLKTVK